MFNRNSTMTSHPKDETFCPNILIIVLNTVCRPLF